MRKIAPYGNALFLCNKYLFSDDLTEIHKNLRYFRTGCGAVGANVLPFESMMKVMVLPSVTAFTASCKAA